MERFIEHSVTSAAGNHFREAEFALMQQQAPSRSQIVPD
jgi:hypothetical protein